MVSWFKAISRSFSKDAGAKATYWRTGVAGIVILALSIWFYLGNRPNAYALLLNGEQIALVEDQAMVESVLKKLSGEMGWLGQVGFQERLEYQEVRAKAEELISAEALEGLLREKLTFTTRGTVIKVDDQVVAAVASEEVAQKALEEVKKANLPQGENIVIQDVKIREKVAFETREVPVASLLTEEQLKSLLLNGVDQVKTYTVQQGDSLWSIARNHNMTVAELKAANPQLEGEKLDLGQRLNLVETKPLLHVVVVTDLKTTVPIPFEVKVEKDKSLMRGQEKVKQEGVPGKKEMEYRIVYQNGVQIAKEKLKETIVQKPVPKIVTRGTKLVLASRGERSQGILSWPLRGRLTSRFGYRGREFHTGLDIAASKGQPVRAAEDGVVTYSGWAGNYGYMVAINHGDGLVTRYAHNSELLVGVGDKVQRGEIIARVGSTGRSTGSHLHFEVMINGQHYNPLSYLK